MSTTPLVTPVPVSTPFPDDGSTAKVSFAWLNFFQQLQSRVNTSTGNVTGQNISPAQVSSTWGYQTRLGQNGPFDTPTHFFNVSWDGAHAHIWIDATDEGYITLTPSSDYRLKKDVSGIADATGLVNKLRPVWFKWIDRPSDAGVHSGFIAHEVQAVLPGAAYGKKDAPAMQGLNTNDIVAVLTRAVQELLARVESLEARLT